MTSASRPAQPKSAAVSAQVGFIGGRLLGALAVCAILFVGRPGSAAITAEAAHRVDIMLPSMDAQALRILFVALAEGGLPEADWPLLE